MSRKEVKIDWPLVERHLQAGCSGVEISGIIGVHENTLYNRAKKDLGVEFMEFSRQKKASGDASIRLAQYTAALDGDRTMLVWLGKNRLGQADKTEITTDPDTVKIKAAIEARAREKGRTYEEECKLFLDNFAADVLPQVREKLISNSVM